MGVSFQETPLNPPTVREHAGAAATWPWSLRLASQRRTHKLYFSARSFRVNELTP